MVEIYTSTTQVKGLINSILKIRDQSKEEIKETLRKNRVRKGFYMIDNLGINMTEEQLTKYINQWFMVNQNA